MSGLEKMSSYIKKTNIPYRTKLRYSLYLSEMSAFLEQGTKGNMDNLLDAFCLSFDYGKAKGYRAGKKAAKEAKA